MSGGKYLKCACCHCEGGIEFPPDGIGSIITCPHCGQETELILETATDSSNFHHSRKWIVAGVIILIVGVVGSIGALITAKILARKRQSQVSVVVPSAQKAAAKTPPKSEPVSELNSVINHFTVFPVIIEKKSRSGSLVYATGSVRNDADKQRFGVTVEIELLNRAGSIIGTAQDYKDLIEPHADWKFRALLVVKDVASARISAVREQ